MRQLPLAIGDEARPSFDNFLPGANAAAMAELRALPQGSTPLYLWSASGGGKTHLLQALAAEVQQRGGKVSWLSPAVPLPWCFDEACELIVLDDCDRFDAARQQAAFSLFVEAATHALPIAASGRLPPVDLRLRDDLRSRLGWGHVFALEPLDEADTRTALRREADRRGVLLSDEVLDYLLTRFSRNLKDLMNQLDRLDSFSLAAKRAISVPLLKRMLAQESAAGTASAASAAGAEGIDA